MRVRAIAFGEYKGKRKPGVEFEFTGKPSEKWMEPVDDEAREAFKKAGFKTAPAPEPPEIKEVKVKGPKGKGFKGKGFKVGEKASPSPSKPEGSTGGSTGDQNVI